MSKCIIVVYFCIKSFVFCDYEITIRAIVDATIAFSYLGHSRYGRKEKHMKLQTMFLREKSFEGYDDRSVLECLLTTAGIRGDVPALIEKLFDIFGNFKSILEARPDQLMSVPGMREKAATLIAMVTPLARVWEKCNMQEPGRITNRREAEAYCKSLLMGERTERFYVISVNSQCRILGTQRISEGSLSEVSAYPRLVAEAALNHNAHSVFFCHNHPGGTESPSAEDIASTLQLQRLLNSMDILVLDHIIVAGSNAYSMAQHVDIDFRVRGAA